MTIVVAKAHTKAAINHPTHQSSRRFLTGVQATATLVLLALRGHPSARRRYQAATQRHEWGSRKQSGATRTRGHTALMRLESEDGTPRPERWAVLTREEAIT